MKPGKKIVSALAGAGIGYSLGSINSAYIAGTIRGYDIRKKGSGNAGATNTMLIMGKKAGLIVMAFDIFKANTAVKLSRRLFPSYKSAGEIAGAASIIGHMFPAWMDFRGGKGLACIGGTILAFGKTDFAVTLAMALGVLFSTKYLCFVPISASVFYPIYHGIKSGNWEGSAILGTVALPVFAKHIENIKRIEQGTELQISFLWNEEEELQRIGWTGEGDSVEDLDRSSAKNTNPG